MNVGCRAITRQSEERLPVVMGTGSTHDLKYSLAYVVDGVCVLRVDNESGKGDHFHRGDTEVPYAFTSLEQLLADFWTAVDDWR